VCVCTHTHTDIIACVCVHVCVCVLPTRSYYKLANSDADLPDMLATALRSCETWPIWDDSELCGCVCDADAAVLEASDIRRRPTAAARNCASEL
jgi:hypothetical protein